MNRRSFLSALTLGTSSATLAVEAEQPSKVAVQGATPLSVKALSSSNRRVAF